MQLDKSKNIKSALFAASCSLIGANTHAEGWDYDAALMYYGESDGRVTAVEGIVNATKEFEDDRSFKAKLVFDSLTGASANGAVPQEEAQTFTRPSGNDQYTTSALEVPLDDTFKDTRVQLAGQWSQPLGENYTFSTGANISAEYDYKSIAVNSVFGRYLNKKNTTLSAGVSYAYDFIQAVGGRPVGLAEMVVDTGQFASQEEFRLAFNQTRQDGDDTKQTADLIFGLTQVMSRNWITQFNLSLSEVSGYQTDPYKVVSVVDTAGLATSQLYENRPDSRSKQALFMQSKYHFGASIWDISYRYTNDDWNIKSHTLETRLRFLLGSKSYIEPHIRYYQQSEADFYRPFLFEGETLPDFASADYRIGKLDALTFGLKYGRTTSKGNDWAVRLEYYVQTPKSVAGNEPGVLSNLDLYPDLSATILQFSYSF